MGPVCCFFTTDTEHSRLQGQKTIRIQDRQPHNALNFPTGAGNAGLLPAEPPPWGWGWGWGWGPLRPRNPPQRPAVPPRTPERNARPAPCPHLGFRIGKRGGGPNARLTAPSTNRSARSPFPHALNPASLRLIGSSPASRARHRLKRARRCCHGDAAWAPLTEPPRPLRGPGGTGGGGARPVPSRLGAAGSGRTARPRPAFIWAERVIRRGGFFWGETGQKTVKVDPGPSCGADAAPPSPAAVPPARGCSSGSNYKINAGSQLLKTLPAREARAQFSNNRRPFIAAGGLQGRVAELRRLPLQLLLGAVVGVSCRMEPLLAEPPGLCVVWGVWQPLCAVRTRAVRSVVVF